MDANRLTQLINSLRKESNESEWVEFKVNNSDPEAIGEYVSALSNAAALLQMPTAYLIWGIDDKTHDIVGTKFNPSKEKINGQELESWLINHLSPRVDFRFYRAEITGKNMVLMEIPAARHTPVRFRDTEFVRVGSYKKKLKDYSEKEAALWRLFRQYPFERDFALTGLNIDEVLRLLDYPSYFNLMDQPLPPDPKGIIDRLVDERIITPDSGSYNITNMGAILFARDLNSFDRLGRKALRIIFYKGKNKIETIREYVETKGYAVGYEPAVNYINNLLPVNEHIGEVFRREVRMYPEIAIRELVANALIHQDFSITGASPTVEIYSDRIEITNPGEPLIEPLRFIDKPPRSRNEDLASFMRRINICEERGSGIDKVIFHVELYQLPPPDFRVNGDNTIAALYADKPISQMSQQEKIRACYQHTVLRYMSNERMTNASLRNRFKIEDKNYSVASRIIRETIKAELIKPFDPDNQAIRYASYVPFWAVA